MKKRLSKADRQRMNMYGTAVSIIADALTVTEAYKDEVIARRDLTFHGHPAMVSRIVPEDTTTEFALVRTNADHRAVFSWFAVMNRLAHGKLDFAE